jgi:hypothetical protein
VEGVVVQVDVPRVGPQCRADARAEERQVQRVAGAEDDRVHLVRAPVDEMHHAAVDAGDPRPGTIRPSATSAGTTGSA